MKGDYLQAQVSYSQGLVRTYLAPREMLVAEFADAARRHGRIRRVRFLPDVDRATAERMSREGSATLLGEAA